MANVSNSINTGNDTIQTKFVTSYTNSINTQNATNEPTFLTFHLVFQDIDEDYENLTTDDFFKKSPLFGYGLNTARHFLTSRNLSPEIHYLNSFIKRLKDISINNPWFYQDITGLKQMWKGGFDMSKPFRASKTELKVSTLESLDWSITYLADLYSAFTYDQELMQEILPDNLRWFNCQAYVIEWRNLVFNTGTGVFKPKDKNQDKNKKYYNEYIKTFKRHYINKEKDVEGIDDLKANMKNYICFDLYQCEFDFSNTVPFDSLFVSKLPEMAKNGFSIKPGRIEINSQYGFQNLTIHQIDKSESGHIINPFFIDSDQSEEESKKATDNNSKTIHQAPASGVIDDWWDFCWGASASSSVEVSGDVTDEQKAQQEELEAKTSKYEKNRPRGREHFIQQYLSRKENVNSEGNYQTDYGKEIKRLGDDDALSHYENSTVYVDYDITQAKLSRVLGRNELSAPGNYLGDSYAFASDAGKLAHSYITLSDKDTLLLSWNANRTRSNNEHGFFGQVADDYYEIAGAYDYARDVVRGVKSFFNMSTREKLETVRDEIMNIPAVQNVINDWNYAKERIKDANAIFRDEKEYSPTKYPLQDYPTREKEHVYDIEKETTIHSSTIPADSNLERTPDVAKIGNLWEHEKGIGKKSNLGSTKSNFEDGHEHEKEIGKKTDSLKSSSDFEDGYEHETEIGKLSNKHSDSNFEEGYTHEENIGKISDNPTKSSFLNGWAHETGIGKKTENTTQSLFENGDTL